MDSLVDGFPAYRAGIHIGDLIVAIDGQQTRGKTAQACSNAIRGKPGATVVLTVERLDGARSVFRIHRTALPVTPIPVQDAQAQSAPYLGSSQQICSRPKCQNTLTRVRVGVSFS